MALHTEGLPHGHHMRQSPALNDTSLSARREQLSQRQKAWKEDVVDDADLYELMGSDYFSLHGMPTELELSMLYQSLTAPGIPDEERIASPKQLIQLLHSRDGAVVLYSLKQIAARLEHDDMDVGHLVTAIQPMVAVVTRGEQGQEDVYWAVLFVLQQLCLEDRHAMTIGDLGGTSVLIALIDVCQRPMEGLESVNHTILSNILNAIWLTCCYEGNGDLSAYNEEKGPIDALLALLCQLRESAAALHDTRRRLRDDFMDVKPSEPAFDPTLVVLRTLERLSALKAYRGQITAAGGIEHCVPVLKHDNLEHRVTALAVCQNLMVDNSLEFVVLGGTQCVAQMLASPYEVEHSAAQNMCLHLFRVRGDLLSLASDLVACGCLAVCASLAQAANKAVARRSLSVLGVVCRYGPEDYSFLLAQERGFVSAVVSMLRDSNLASLQQATALLWYLTRVEATHLQLVHAGAVPILKDLLSRAQDPTLLHNTMGSLRRLECFDDLGENYTLPDTDRPVIQW